MFNRSGSLSMSAICMPKIVISRVAIEKMKAYVTHCNKEIGWLGTAIQSGNVIFIQDMFLFEQEVNETTCEINEKAVATWYEELLTTHPNGMEIVNAMRVWGHSHVNMAVSPSGQDESQFKELSKNVTDFFIRIIANKKGDMRLDYYNAQLGITFNNMEWLEEVTIDEVAVAEEIKQKVKQKVYYVPPKTTAKQPYLQSVKPSAATYETSYDWYDEYYGNYSTGNKTQKDYFQTWEDITSGEELIQDFGFKEENVTDIASLNNSAEVMVYMEKHLGDAYVIEDEAEHLMDIAREYTKRRYGSI